MIISKLGFSQLMGLGLSIATLGGVVVLEPSARAETQPVWYNCLTREVFTPEKKIWCDRWQTLQNATYIVPTSLDADPEYTTVTLSNGRYQRQDNKFIVELVNQPVWIAFGDINNDGKEDAAVIFGVALDPDGKAVSTYLTAVLDIDREAQALNPVRLGERIVLGDALAIDNNRVALPFLTATEVVNRTFIICGTVLKECL